MNNILKIISESSLSEELTSSFRGVGFHTYHIVISIDRTNGILERWNVYSRGRRSTLTNYLYGKLLWDELTQEERQVFWTLPEILKDKSIYLGLKALALGLSKKILRDRLINSPFDELTAPTRQQYISMKGQSKFLLIRKKLRLQKTPKYSGYTRHYKDKGNLPIQREEILSEILEPVYGVSEDILLRYLTVGEISLPLWGECITPKSSKK